MSIICSLSTSRNLIEDFPSGDLYFQLFGSTDKIVDVDGITSLNSTGRTFLTMESIEMFELMDPDTENSKCICSKRWSNPLSENRFNSWTGMRFSVFLQSTATKRKRSRNRTITNSHQISQAPLIPWGTTLLKQTKTMFRQDDVFVQRSPFLGFVKVCFEKAPMMLKAKAVLEYPSYAVLLTFSPRFCRWLMNNGDSFIGFQLVGNVKIRKAQVGANVAFFTGPSLTPL